MGNKISASREKTQISTNESVEMLTFSLVFNSFIFGIHLCSDLVTPAKNSFGLMDFFFVPFVKLQIHC